MHRPHQVKANALTKTYQAFHIRRHCWLTLDPLPRHHPRARSSTNADTGHNLARIVRPLRPVGDSPDRDGNTTVW
jgi:hypothetical protein